METVYFISGLGADERAFRFLDLSFCKPVFVKWIKPRMNESIADYAGRLKEQIPGEKPVIVGLSFGGMISIELAKRFPYSKIILIASAKTAKEIPPHLKLMRWLPVHKIASPSFIRAGNQFAYRIMGIHNRADKVLFTEMLTEADDDFLKWAIDRIINWRNQTIPARTIHIHGDKDMMLPKACVACDYTVKGGKHLMVMTKPKEIEEILKRLI